LAERLSSLDVTYLSYDIGPMPMNSGGLFMFEPGEDGTGLSAPRLTALLAERLHLLKRYRQVPVQAGIGGPWVWADDPAFDLSRHVHHHRLPPPGGDAELAALVGRLHSGRLDPAHPLWEKHAIEGLAGGGSALVMRWQHAMVDGMSAIEVIKTLFDTSPGAPVPRSPGQGTPSSPSPRADGSRPAKGVGAGFDLVADLDRATAFLDGWIAQLEAIRGSRWFREASDRVRLGFDTIPDQALRTPARTAGVGLDVAFLTVVAAGVSDVLAARGAVGADDVIRTVVPMAIPIRGRRELLGNHAAFYVVALPIGPMPVGRRLVAVAEAVAAARPADQVATIATMIERFDRVPDWLVALASRVARGSGSVDLIVTYVRGPRRPLWLSGLPHASTHPLMPLGGFVRLMVGAVNLGGRVGLSVTADPAALPEVDFLLDRMERAALGLAGG
jgi:WS/DGAT/MGAT family acyltransferase